MEYIKSLNPAKLAKLLSKAYEKEIEGTAWEYWLTLDQQTKKSNPFKDFLESLKKEKPTNKDTRTEKEVLEDSNLIINMLKNTSTRE
jgi:hypothetical protein